MQFLSRSLTVALTLTAIGCADGREPELSADPPDGVSFTADEVSDYGDDPDGHAHLEAHDTWTLGHLDVGEIVDVQPGLALAVPPPGESIGMDVVYNDETSLSVALDTDADGVVRVRYPEHEAFEEASATSGAARSGCRAACGDGSWTPFFENRARWRSRYDWYYNHATSPKGKQRTINALKNGINGIINSRNDCGLDDRVSATALYRGETTRRPAPRLVNRVVTCDSARLNDGVNVVGWGDLGPTTLAVACVRRINTTIVAADMTFHRRRDWFTDNAVPNVCSTRYSLRGVATHEAGHAFGLGHSGCAQTMAPSVGTCDNSIRTLGRGDVIGLRTLY